MDNRAKSIKLPLPSTNPAQQMSTIPAFLLKLRNLLDDPANDDLICWNAASVSGFDVKKYYYYVMPFACSCLYTLLLIIYNNNNIYTTAPVVVVVVVIFFFCKTP